MFSKGFKICVQYLDIHPHKPIFYPYNYYDGSNIIRLTRRGNEVEEHKTHNVLERHLDADHDIIIDKRRLVSGIFHNMLGVAVCWKVHIQPAISHDSTDGEIRCMYKYVKKTQVIQRYMEALELHTSAKTIH